MFFSETDFKSARGTLYERHNISLESESVIKGKTAFLSHSHKDVDIAKNVALVLRNYGLDLWIDSEHMAYNPSKESAGIIRKVIGKADIFILFCTNNACESRWVPWETGIADMIKKEKVYILPVKDDSGSFKGNEYLQLYKRIQLIDNKLYIVNPERTPYDWSYSVPDGAKRAYDFSL